MMSKSKITIAAFIAIAAIIAGIYAQQFQQTKSAMPKLNKAVILPNSKALNHVDFVDHNGKPFNADSLKGYWNILFFGFTNCPDICPTTMRTLQQVKASAEAANKWGNYRVIMVTVDPERDTVTRLKDYVPYFDEEFIGLRADLDTTTKFAKQLGILFIKQPSSDGFYNIDHGASLILVSPEGKMTGVMTAPHKADLIGKDLSLLADHFSQDHQAKPEQTAAMTAHTESNSSHSMSDHSMSDHSMSDHSMSDHSMSGHSMVDKQEQKGDLKIEGLVISDAWIRPSPANVMSLAAYFKLTNQTDSDITIVAAQSPDFNMVMMHDSVLEDGLAKMQHRTQIIIPAGGEFNLVPSGTHLMLMQPNRQPLNIGDTAEISLISASGARLSQTVEVKLPSH